MTPEQINRTLAEKLMGWTDIDYYPGGNILYGCPNDDYNRLYPTNKERWPIPDYYADISQAIEVVEKFQDWSIRKTKIAVLLTEDAYRCSVYYNDEWISGTGKAPSAAICEAAVEALTNET